MEFHGSGPEPKQEQRDKMPRLTEPRYRFPILCMLLFVAVQFLERALLVILTAADGGKMTAELLFALPAGLLQDMAMAVLIGLPFLLGLHHFPRLAGHRYFIGGAHFLLLGLLALLVFENFASVIFWNEFDSRFNGIAVNYLLFPREVIGNIRESFDLHLLLPAVGAIALVLYGFLRRPLTAALSGPRPNSHPGRHRNIYPTVAAAAALAGLIVYTGPIPVGDNRQANELAANSIHSFLSAAWTNDTVYDALYPGMNGDAAVALARAQVAQDNTRFLTPPGTRSLLRRVDNGTRPKRLNVVLVIEESFGSIYVDGLDNVYLYPDGDPAKQPGETTQPRPETISPNLVRLAKDGMFFANNYATGARTVRGLEALLTSFAPIPGISTARRPGSKNMHSLPFILKDEGYRTAFLYGGRGQFDNMATFWSQIGFDRVWDQSDIADTGFTTAWGAADEYLFSEALKRIDDLSEGEAPFFLGLLTVSNHRPYSYPEGRIGKDPGARRRENAATYADWAFGDFIERARKKPWFSDTVFIFASDHGPRLSGSAQVPVDRYRVPLLFYAPGHIPAGRIETLGSSLDMAPTLLGLLSVSYDSPFFGVDLMRVPKGEGRVVMSHNYSVAYARKGQVVTLEPGLRSKGYAIQTGVCVPPGCEPLHLLKRPDAETLRRAVALTQTAHRMFYAGEYHRTPGQTAGR